MIGNETQRNKYVPLLRDLVLTGGWGLTENKHGSDASSLETTVQRTEGERKRDVDESYKKILFVK